jgi:hypothetical protein
MTSTASARNFRIVSCLILAGGLCLIARSGSALPSAPAPVKSAATPAKKSAPAIAAPKAAAAKSSAAKPIAGQTVSGSAGVNYSFKLPAGLTLATPAREKPDNFTEFTASTSPAGSAPGETSRPFRFEARVATFDKPVDCAIFTQFSEGLTRSFMSEHFFDQSPAATQKIAGATFLVKLFHKEVPPDFNQKSAAVNVAHYLTTQGDAILSLVFYTDARDEAKGQAQRDAILKSLHLGSSSGNAVCKSAPHSTPTSAPSPSPSAAKPVSSPK